MVLFLVFACYDGEILKVQILIKDHLLLLSTVI